MRRRLLVIALFSLSLILVAQSKIDYLKENRFDLDSSDFQFPQDSFKVFGFGAYHGSSKTYDVELLFIKSLKQQGRLDYYIPETNFSQAYYFQQYLDTGNEELLKELTLGFQTIVTQEGTIDTYNHWKALKKLNDSLSEKDKIKVIGFDAIAEYYFPIKHILELTEGNDSWKERLELKNMLNSNVLSDSLSEQGLKRLITSYEKSKCHYKVKDKESFVHILANLELVFQEGPEREKIIYDNFITLSERYHLSNKIFFFKYGGAHIQKQREWDYPYFFTRLIENNNYKRNEVVSVRGYLTDSKVLWDKIYNENGEYERYTIKRGYGIDDYWKIYYKGIGKLKRTRLSDMTLFKIASKDSPYNNGVDLIEMKVFLRKANKKALRGKNTAEFIDYAVLICDSKEQVPLEEMKEE